MQYVIRADLLEKGRKVMELYYKLLLDRIFELTLGPDKWKGKNSAEPKVNDIVLFIVADPATGKEWKLGRVIEVEDRKVSVIHVGSSKENAIPTMKIAKRSFRDIAIIIAEDETALNTKQYMENLKDTFKI